MDKERSERSRTTLQRLAETNLAAVKEYDPNKVKQPFKLKDLFVCEEFCKVRQKWVDVYFIPIDKCLKDKHSQNRKKSSSPKVVTFYATLIKTQGLETAVCVWPAGDGTFRLRWGNTRKRAIDQIYRDKDTVPGIPNGFIRASLYNEPFAELPELQSRENHIHTPGEYNDMDSDVLSMENIISNGRLDDYDDDGVGPWIDQTDKEKQRRMKAHCKIFMPRRFTGTAFDAFYRAFKKNNKSQFKLESWTVGEMRDHLLKANPWGITAADKAPSRIKDVYIKAGIRYGFYFTDDIANKGATLQLVRKAKKLNKFCDKIVIVSADPAKTFKGIPGARQGTKAEIEAWNSLDVGSNDIDYSLHVPLTKEELKGAAHWPVFNTYK